MRGDYALNRALETTDCLRLTFRGDTAAVRQAMHEIEQSPLFCIQAPALQQDTQIVVAEVLNNIVEHAYANRPGDITVLIRLLPTGLAFQISDTGLPMPGLVLPTGAFQELGEIETLPEGGFGWFMIRSLTSDLTYQNQKGVNLLSFVMNCGQTPNSVGIVSN